MLPLLARKAKTFTTSIVLAARTTFDRNAMFSTLERWLTGNCFVAGNMLLIAGNKQHVAGNVL